METAVEVDRAQVLAYRIAAQGLDHASGSARVGQLAVLDLGVQDSSAGSVKLALAARLPDLPPDDLAAGDDVDDGLSLAWTHRGAPHLHRTADLPSMAAANWPRNDADAAARLGWQRARLAEAGVAGRDAFDESAAAVHDVVAEQMLDGNGGYTAMTKGAVSTAVTAKVSPGLSPYCRPCGCHHISEQLLRLTALPGGVRLAPVPAPLLLAPLPDWPWPPAEPAGTDTLISTYLRLLGPATPADAAGFLGTSRGELTASWPEGVVEVRVDGRKTWLPVDSADALRDAEPSRVVRLLPPSDPLLQGRDRDLLVPDRAHQKALWRALQSPGALLVNGEITGTWRAKLAGKRRLDLEVRPFSSLAPADRAKIDEQAQRVAAVRGVAEAGVRYGHA